MLPLCHSSEESAAAWLRANWSNEIDRE